LAADRFVQRFGFKEHTPMSKKSSATPVSKSVKTNSARTNSKDSDLERDALVPGEVLTTNQGLALADDQNSLKAGVRGPTLLEDFHFREKITHFDHERIPERVVHARGVAAHGYFEAASSAADITKAGLFAKGKRTPVFVRFSTVAGSRGSADTPRDVRGFAVKFYTDEGVWDLVGNNIPVFFIQDAIKFPDLIHAVKPEPHNEIPQAASAHDTFWDFISLTPEAMHMIMWVMSDRAFPRSLAMMEGFGIHTFRFINAEGVSTFVKFHFKPKKGVHSLVWDEAQKTAGKDADFNRRDLFESIERGDFPEWEMGVQVIPEADEHKFDFDLLDPTKLVPEELVPIRPLGKLVLNRNPDNYFAETEQVAFHPGHIVPGIDFSNDPLLQGRLFSYTDTQLKRVGPNFAQLPINRPTCPFSNNQRDGESQQLIHKGRVAYFPNSLAGGCPAHSPEGIKAFSSYAEKMDGEKVRVRSESFGDHFSQATLFWNSMAQWEKNHIISAISFELNMVQTMEVKQRVIDELLVNVAEELAQKVAMHVGMKVTGKRKSKPHDNTSPALSMDWPAKDIVGRKVAILVADGADAEQVKAIKASLEAEKASASVIGKTKTPVKGAKGKSITVDQPAPNAPSIMFDGVFVPDGTASLAANPLALSFLADHYAHGKPIAVMGDGLRVLKTAVPTIDPEQSKLPGIIADNSQIKQVSRLFIDAIKKHRFPERQPETMMA
jgi:catalase